MDYSAFKQKFNISLNDEQDKAVKEVDGPVLLLAVPGSGKTTALITRLGYMIFGKGISAENILTVTYTVSATKEMAERFKAMFNAKENDTPEFRTINGMSASIIINYEKQTGSKGLRLVTDEKRLAEIVNRCYRRYVAIYPTDADIKNCRTQITYAKNMMLTDSEITALDVEGFPFSKIYKDYCNELVQNNLMDYDDQMVYAYKILTENSDLLEFYRQKYKYVCVDEAQDTSKIQHKIIALLVEKNRNIFMVGDEDQSIYGFRAAYPDALMNFAKNYSGAKVFYLEKNYRSTPSIVDAAKRFIDKNKRRHEKNMSAVRDGGEDICQVTVVGRRGQYSHIVSVAEKCTEETAVLYRDNESVLPVVDLLERKGIAYNIRNAELTFFTNRVVQDVTNIIKFAYNPKSVELFTQIYYKIATFLQKEKVRIACDISKKKSLPVLDAVISYADVNSRTATSCSLVRTWLKNLTKQSASDALTIIRTQLGYDKYLSRCNMSNKSLDILKELAKQENSAYSLLNRLNFLSNLLKDKPYQKDCKFLLSTIHSSKGQEYEKVYLLDVYDGVFPDTVANLLSSEKALCEFEEERRLFYVGVTRAKNNLNVFRTGMPSVFINQLIGDAKPVIKSAPQTPIRTVNINQQVEHKVYGKGVVVAQDEEFIQIQFATVGAKKFLHKILCDSDKMKIID